MTGDREGPTHRRTRPWGMAEYPRSMRRLLPAVPAVLLFLALAAGCGGPSAQEELARAAGNTVRADSLRAEVSAQVRVSGAPSGSVPVTGSALVVDGGERVRGTVDLSALEDSSRSDGPSETVVVGELVYLRLPSLNMQLRQAGVEEEWLVADEQTQQAAGLGTGPAGLGSADPTEVVGALRDSAREVEEAGSEDVRGMPTTRYTATLDLSGAEGRAEEGLPETVPTEVWIGEDRLVRRVRQRFSVRQGGDVEYTLELFDFGVQATVEPPPEEDTIPFEEAIAAMREG